MRVMILALLLTAACGEPKCTAPLVETLPGVCHVPGGEAGKGEAGHVAEPFVIVERDAGQRADLDQDGGKIDGQQIDKPVGGSGGVGGIAGSLVGAVSGSRGAGLPGEPEFDHGHGGGVSGASMVGGAGGSVGATSLAGSYSPPPVCGNGILEHDETCDGDCPSCDDGDPCTSDTMTGSKTSCDVKCEHKAITAAITGDKCCPREARASADGDCVCRGDFDCGGDEYCSGARCHLLACVGDNDCADDRWCTSTGQCGLRRDGLCDHDRNCLPGQVCKVSAGIGVCG